MRLNLGCGKDIRAGWVNVDIYGQCDVKHDLNVRPWPWASDSIEEIIMHHVMEHLPNMPLVMQEIYRVCRKDALVHIAVPHPFHDDFISDPTHVSRVTPRALQAFSKKFCELVKNDANQPLAVIYDVDFEVEKQAYVVEKRWMQRVIDKLMTEEQLYDAILTCNNVVKQIEMTVRVVK